MISKKRLGINVGLALLVNCYLTMSSSFAESVREEPTIVRSIQIAGRTQATVTGPEIRVSDIALVSSKSTLAGQDDEALIALQKIIVDKSPNPGHDMALSASQVIEVLKAAGVDFQKVAYRLPRVITVHRASRPVSKQEVRAAIDQSIKELSRDIQIRDIEYVEETQVLPGMLTLSAEPFGSQQRGRMLFHMHAKVENADELTFDVNANVDEWTSVPVARKSLMRGSVVGADDVVMARLNITGIPKDALQDRSGILGLETQDEIGVGEYFRRGKLVVPPVINSGARVSMVYRSGNLEMAASGVALESGAVGQEIKVRNDASKKVISGTVLEAGLVGVKP